MIKLLEQLSGYKQFFTDFKPELACQNDETIHRTLSYVLDIQFEKVKSPQCIKSIEKKLDQLIRNIKAEFDFIHTTFEGYDFPDFVLDLAATKVHGYLSSYHCLVVSLLKILTIAMLNENNSNEVYEYVLDYDTNQLSPERQKVLFSEETTHAGINDSDVGELTLKQLDIDLKELF